MNRHKNLISKKLKNSVLVCGNKGIGNFFFNKIIEKYIKLNTNQNQRNHHLNLFANNSHPNIKILNKKLMIKPKIKKFISIDQIRELNNFL